MGKKKIKLIISFVMAVLFIMAGQCLAATKTLKVGVLGPFTGPSAQTGKEFKASFESQKLFKPFGRLGYSDGKHLFFSIGNKLKEAVHHAIIIHHTCSQPCDFFNCKSSSHFAFISHHQILTISGRKNCHRIQYLFYMDNSFVIRCIESW